MASPKKAGRGRVAIGMALARLTDAAGSTPLGLFDTVGQSRHFQPRFRYAKPNSLVPLTDGFFRLQPALLSLRSKLFSGNHF
jgi:hypothetical protein